MAEVIPLFPGPAPRRPRRPPRLRPTSTHRRAVHRLRRGPRLRAWTVNLYARLCADDIPALRDEIHHLERSAGSWPTS
ncbi:hypothetical protein [Micromonospora pallida]|uniref:hypothetical protein n=1 Tax=Micromonospora pallida TaxID=145854 RepID=UPI00114D3759|nr:hypothetical protein [Micromonospora pallida]